MEVLTNKLADLLQVGVDGATKAYPVLREQYIWYKIFGEIMATTGIVLFVLFVFGLFALLVFGLSYDSRYPKWFPKLCKIFGIVAVVALVVMVGSSMLRVVLAPDIMMILEML